MIRTLLSICCLFFSITAFASVKIDSIGVEDHNGKKTILHKVDVKESYYSIARKYGVNPKDIISANNNKAVQPGTLLKIPTDRNFTQQKTAIANKTINNPEGGGTVTDYKIGPKETLFAISRKFNTTVDDIKRLNNLKGNALAAGQIIKVRYGSGTANQPPVTPVTPVVFPKSRSGNENPNAEIDSSVNASDRLKLPPVRYGLRELNERGVAVWIDDQNLDGTKMLALHRTAPIGTVVKITNPMSNKSTFAKVVGKFTENESTRDVLIVITRATADLVGALDKRFQVNIVYGVPVVE